jgi:glycosyltransferase involved in cell wall biosynthesis
VNLQQFLLERGLGDRSEAVLNFGIDVNRTESRSRDEIRRTFGLDDVPIVLYSGVIDQFQRLDLLLGAMVHVLRRVPRAKLLVLSTIHNAKHEQAIREKASHLGIDSSVILRMPADMEKGRRLLAVCDVAVVPRPCAPGFPIKLLNYMAARRPCVMYASSASGISHGEHAWLAGEDTSRSLAEGIIRVLTDGRLAARLAAGGNRFARERHDRRKVAAQLCQTYVRLLAGTKRWHEIAQRPLAKSPWQEPSETGGLDLQPRGHREGVVHAGA